MTKKENNYAFIDSQNLNLGSRDLGWKLDLYKFRIYLSNKYRVKKAFLFIGYIREYIPMYTQLSQYGYILIFKEIVKHKGGKIKGNIDAELVMYTMKEINNFRKAIIVSGDGDFYCLVKYLKNLNKLKAILVPNKKSCSSLLKEFKRYKDYLEDKNFELRK